MFANVPADVLSAARARFEAGGLLDPQDGATSVAPLAAGSSVSPMNPAAGEIASRAGGAGTPVADEPPPQTLSSAHV